MPEADITRLIDDTTAAFRTLLEDAVHRAYRAGGDDRAASIVAAAQGLMSAPATFTTVAGPVLDVSIPVAVAAANGTYRTKAPRGLLEKVLERVFAERQGLTTTEVEQAVLAMDERIALKSIYNQLRAAEKAGGPYVRNSKGLWVTANPVVSEAPVPVTNWPSATPALPSSWFGRSSEGGAG